MRKNILCIDDIEMNLFSLKSLFENLPNIPYNIFTALSAEKGLELLLQESINLILLDIMMPEVDGLAMAKMIHSNKKLKNIPIIFLTAKTDDDTIRKCYEVGGSDYVSKPFNSVELLKRVDFHLNFKDKEKLLQKEKEYAQNIVDLQDNLILITDGEDVVNVNKAVLDFFGVDTLFDFQKQYHCVCQSFKEVDGYFSTKLLDNGNNWIDEVIKRLEKEDIVVAIEDKEKKIHDFTIKAKRFYDLYILSLTDITVIAKRTKKFEHQANFDALTQIYNRNMFNQLMDEKLKETSLNNTNISFVILDIDHFKDVNDTYGHLAGDKVLKHLTSLISKHTRASDIFARWGGEEFILALETDKEHGIVIVENLRTLIEKEPFEDVGKITCSFGLTEFKKGDTIKSITSRADEALYEAKESGRNRVCIK